MAERRLGTRSPRELRPTPDEWTVATRLAQGLPPVITDPVTLANIEWLVCSALGCGHWVLEPPNGLDAGGVGVPPLADPTDHHVVEHPGQDGTLPLQGQRRPLLGERDAVSEHAP